MRIKRGLYAPPRWFAQELRLIDSTLLAVWSHRICRWIILHEEGWPALIVQNPGTKEFYPLDQRTLRKLRINKFFTHNPAALERYLVDDGYALLSYVARGLRGVEDHLSGWV